MGRTRGGRRHTPSVERALDIARMVRGESDWVTDYHLPDRDATDRYGDTAPGLSRMKLKYRDLSADEQATDSTDDRVLASGDTNAERAVGSSHIKTGEITDAHVQQRWAKTTQHNDTLYKNQDGKLPSDQLPANVVQGSYNGHPGKLGAGDIGGLPDFSKFLTKVPKAYVTKGELNTALSKYAKKSHKHGGG